MTFNGGTTVRTRKEDLFYVSGHWNVLDNFYELLCTEEGEVPVEYPWTSFTPFVQYALKILKNNLKYKSSQSTCCHLW